MPGIFQKVKDKNLRLLQYCLFKGQGKISEEFEVCQDQKKKLYKLSLVVRKPVFGVSDQVRHKPGSTTTQDG